MTTSGDTVTVGRCVICYAIIFQDDILTMEPPSELSHFLKFLATSTVTTNGNTNTSCGPAGSGSNLQFEDAVLQLSKNPLRCLCLICSGVCEQILSKLVTSSELIDETNELKQRCIAAIQLSTAMFENEKNSTRGLEGDDPNLKILVWVDVVRQYLLERRTRAVTPKAHLETMEGAERMDSNVIKAERDCEVGAPEVDWTATAANKMEFQEAGTEVKMSSNSRVELLKNRQEMDTHQKKSKTNRPPLKGTLGKKGYQCDICESKLSCRETLRRHKMLKHEGGLGGGINKYTCEYCSKSFHLKCHLSIHITQHIDQEITYYVCHVCQQKFPAKLFLKEHLQECHPEALQKDKLERYELNPVPMTNEKNDGQKIIEDTTSHSSYKDDFQCDICQAKLNTVDAFCRHFRVEHQETKPFACKLCGHRFPWRGQLEVHARSHTGERPFSCSLFDSTFSTKNTFNRHMLQVHAVSSPSSLPASSSSQTPVAIPEIVVRDFKCDICEAQFALQKNLSLHYQEKHLGVKPEDYHCQHCGQKFVRKSDFSKHLALHAFLICPVCPQSFSRKDSLRNHIRKQHAGFKQTGSTS